MLENFTLERINSTGSPKKNNKVVIAFFIVLTLTIPVAAIMKISHLPGASTILNVGLAVEALFVVFLIFQSLREKWKSEPD